MKGIGGHQPINPAQVANDNQTQGGSKASKTFDRFKVSLMKPLKQLFASGSGKPKNVNILSRSAKPHVPAQQSPVSNVQSNGSNRTDDRFSQALNDAKGNSPIRQGFTKVDDALNNLQEKKAQLRNQPGGRGSDEFRKNSLEVRMAKDDYNRAVSNFNKTVGADLKMDAAELEMAVSNQHSDEYAALNQTYDQLREALS